MEPTNDDASGVMCLKLSLSSFLCAYGKEAAKYSCGGGSIRREWFGAFGKLDG